LSPPGDDVEDREERIAAIEGRDWPANNFDPLDQIDVDRELRPEHGFIVNIVVEPMSVDQQQDSGVEVAWPRKSPHPQAAVVAVIGDEETTHRLQNVGQCAVSILLDLIGGDHGNR